MVNEALRSFVSPRRLCFAGFDRGESRFRDLDRILQSKLVGARAVPSVSK